MPQIATFYIGDELFGVNILLTKEIGKVLDITRVPASQNYILGLMNLRGQIVTIMNPSYFLGCKLERGIENCSLIILKNEKEILDLQKKTLLIENKMSRDTLAIAIDSVKDVIDVENEDIGRPPTNLTEQRKEFITGIIQLGDELVLMLDLGRLTEMCIIRNK